MTVSTTIRKVSYVASGSTATFSYTFKIFADSDLKVYQNGVLKTLGSGADYTVTGAGSSSGNVVFNSNPTENDAIVILRELPRTQATDFVENESLPAASLEDAFDRGVMIDQEIDDKAGVGFRFADTVTDAGTITIDKNATDRASKVLAFDSSGGLSADQEIGTSKGDWATSTAYVVRDIVKDTSNNNIYIALTAHTSSGSQPISSNTDSAKWRLIVDAASSTTAQNNAATSAAAALVSQNAAAASAVSTAADVVSTNSNVTTTNNNVTTTNNNVTSCSNSQSACSSSETNAAASALSAASNAGPHFGTTTGTVNSYLLSPNPSITQYAAGQDMLVKIHVANTSTSVTININSLGAKSIKKTDGSDLSVGDLALNSIVELVYDGTNFQLVGTGAATSTDVNFLQADVTSNTVRILEQHGLSAVHTAQGVVDEFESNTDANTVIDATNSTAENYDATNDLYYQTAGSSGQNKDHDFTTETNYDSFSETGTNATISSDTVTINNSDEFGSNVVGARFSPNATFNPAQSAKIIARADATHITLESGHGLSLSTAAWSIRFFEIDSGVAQLSTATTIDFGDGRDGTITNSGSTQTLDNEVCGSSRSTHPDCIERVVTSNPTGTAISVASGEEAGFAAGDKIIIWNKQGTSGDYADAGNYELLTVASTSSGTINTNETISVSFDGTTFSNQNVTVQRVAQYSAVTLSANGARLTCNAWDGNKGGSIPFMCSGTVSISDAGALVSMAGRGYRGGAHGSGGSFGTQGEGERGSGTGAYAANGCGGGGGKDGGGTSNGYGSGGGHGTAGDAGNSGSVTVGGLAVGNANLTTLFMGSGGGGNYNANDGASGGGIIYIQAATISLTGKLNAEGNDANSNPGYPGTGGAGGSILVQCTTLTGGTDLITADKGERGGNATHGGHGAVGRIRLEYTTIGGSAFQHATNENDYCLPDPGSTAAHTGSTLTVSNEYVPVIPVAGQLLSAASWAAENTAAHTQTETLNSGNAYYFEIYETGTFGNTTVFKITDGSSAVRSIARNNAGTWQYNSHATFGSTTWTSATSNNMFQAVRDAMGVAANRYTSTSRTSATATLLDTGFSRGTGIVLYSTNVSNNPNVSQTRINYDSANAALDLRTKQWNNSAGMPAAPSSISTLYAFAIDNAVASTWYYTTDNSSWVEITGWETWTYSSGKTARRKAITGVSGTDPRLKVTTALGASTYNLHAIGLQVR